MWNYDEPQITKLNRIVPYPISLEEHLDHQEKRKIRQALSSPVITRQPITRQPIKKVSAPPKPVAAYETDSDEFHDPEDVPDYDDGAEERSMAKSILGIVLREQNGTLT